MTLTLDQILVAHATKLMILIALLGIIASRRFRLCWVFFSYLLVQLVINILFSFWPERFLVPWFWLLQQVVSDLLRVGVAIELMVRVFRAFPRAKATARRVLITLLVATAGTLIGVPNMTDYNAYTLQSEPRIMTGTVWLMNGLALVVAWYRLPIERLQKAILLGFVPYLLVFTTLLHIVNEHGLALAPYLQVIEPQAYLYIVAFWAWASWKRDRGAPAPPAIAQLPRPAPRRPAARRPPTAATSTLA